MAPELPELAAALLTHSSEGIAVCDEQGTVTHWNAAMGRLSGTEPAVAIGQQILVLLPSLALADQGDPLQRIRTGETLPLRHRWLRSAIDGDEAVVTGHFGPLVAADGSVRGGVLTLSDLTEQVVTVEALSQSEARYRTLLNLIPDGIVVVKDGIITYANEALVSLHGAADASELVGRPALELVHPRSRASVAERLATALRTGTRGQLRRESFLRKDGSTVHAEVVGVPVRLGEREAVVAVLRDLTSQEEAAEHILHLHALAQTVLDSVAEGIVGVDLQGRIILVNRTGARLLGRNPEHLLGEDAHETLFVAPQRRSTPAESSSRLRATLHSGAVLRTDSTQLWRPDGTSFPVDLTVAPLQQEGTITGAVVTFQDIGPQRAAALALEREHLQLLTVINETPAAMAMFDAQMRYVAHSQGWAKELGIEGAPGSSLAGREHRLLMARRDPQWEQGVSMALTGTVVRHTEQMLLRADGTQQRYSWAATPWSSAGGHIGGIIVALQSVEELVAAREQAQAASRLKSEFLASTSHELRTPLNSIIGFTNRVIAHGSSGLDPRDAANLQIVLRNAKLLLALINDLLDLSKVEAGRMPLHCEPMDAQALAYEVVTLLQPQATERGLVLLLEEEAPTLPMVADQEKVRQILINLVNNAIKFTPEGGVTVRCRRTDSGRVHISVLDTGVGIPADQRERIFEPFHQVEGGLNRGGAGSGLGLTLCRQFARLMGGDIELSSLPGGGSAFTLELPIDGTSAEGSTGQAPMGLPRKGADQKVHSP